MDAVSFGTRYPTLVQTDVGHQAAQNRGHAPLIKMMTESPDEAMALSNDPAAALVLDTVRSRQGLRRE